MSTIPPQPTTTGFRAALRQLRAAQKPGRGAPPYSRWVNRRVGRAFAAGFAGTPITPNQVTGLSATCSAAAIAVLITCRPTPLVGLAVGALLLLGYGLDSADGQLARLRGGGSRTGEWLDHIVDAAKVSALHAAVLVSFFRFTDASTRMLAVALGFQVVASVLFFGMILIDQLRRSSPAPSAAADTPTGGGLLQTAVALPTDYGVLCLAFAVLGWQGAFRPAYTTLFVLNTLILLATLWRWWRQVRALDRS